MDNSKFKNVDSEEASWKVVWITEAHDGWNRWYTVKSEIKAAPNYKPLPIIGRTKLPNLYNISRSLF